MCLTRNSTIGTTGTQLKAYVQNIYNTQGVCFILPRAETVPSLCTILCG